jgi:hypothetical protein
LTNEHNEDNSRRRNKNGPLRNEDEAAFSHVEAGAEAAEHVVVDALELLELEEHIVGLADLSRVVQVRLVTVECQDTNRGRAI